MSFFRTALIRSYKKKKKKLSNCVTQIINKPARPLRQLAVGSRCWSNKKTDSVLN